MGKIHLLLFPSIYNMGLEGTRNAVAQSGWRKGLGECWACWISELDSFLIVGYLHCRLAATSIANGEFQFSERKNARTRKIFQKKKKFALKVEISSWMKIIFEHDSNSQRQRKRREVKAVARSRRDNSSPARFFESKLLLTRKLRVRRAGMRN